MNWQKAITRRLSHYAELETDTDPLDVAEWVLMECAGSSTEDDWVSLLEGMAKVLAERSQSYWDAYDHEPDLDAPSDAERWEMEYKRLRDEGLL